MLCSHCGIGVQDRDHFCKNCGASLQMPGGLVQPSAPNAKLVPTPFHAARPPRPLREGNPYRDQIAQLRLQLKEARMNLREVNNYISSTRSNYFEAGSFIQYGLLHGIGRMFEGAQLFSPYQQRKQLQERVMQLERELLPLEQAQEQWFRERQESRESL